MFFANRHYGKLFCSICGIHELDGRAVPYMYKPTCWAKCLAVGAILALRLARWVGPVGISLLARLRALGIASWTFSTRLICKHSFVVRVSLKEIDNLFIDIKTSPNNSIVIMVSTSH